MILACQKLLGQITKVLGLRRTPPPRMGKTPKKSRIFFLRGSLKRIVSSKGFGRWVLSLRYIKRQERAQTYWNFNNNLKTIGNLFHFINLGHLSVKYTWPTSSTFANKFPNWIYVDLVWKFDITMGLSFQKRNVMYNVRHHRHHHRCWRIFQFL